MTSISLSLQIISVSVLILKRQFIHESVSNRNQWSDSYDYVVVGAGSAGAALAYRLIENSKYRVLLLEAGMAQSIATDIPKNYALNINSEYDWKFKTVPQTWFTPYRLLEPRGKVIGGTSTINGMLYNRGNRRDYDLWVEEFGAKGWAYKDLLPYFIRSENNTDQNVVNANPGYHGTRGPVTISSDPIPDPILLIYQKALNDLGIQTTDINGSKQLGTMIAQSFNKEGLRSSTGNAYLEPNPRPDYLHILTKAFVTRILFNGIQSQLTATGVEFVREGIKYTVRANKEVILCAGSYGSPKILMLSGIGPKDHLTQLGIPLLADLPVGDNLQNHPAALIHMLINDNRLVRPGPQLNIEQLYELLVQKTGPLSVFTASFLFYATNSIADKHWPNTYTYSYVVPINDLNLTVLELPGRREEWMQYFKPYLGRYLLLSSPHLSRVRSYGRLRLESSNPFKHPIIDPQFLAHPLDYKDLVEKIKFMLYFLMETEIAKYLSVIPKPIPGCSYCPIRKPYECDSYVQCLIRETIKSGYHPVGTCRMGNRARSDVVVDERLKVKDILGLRVCDASVAPKIPNSNTNAISILIGEKCSELIREDNRN